MYFLSHEYIYLVHCVALTSKLPLLLNVQLQPFTTPAIQEARLLQHPVASCSPLLQAACTLVAC